MASQTSTLEDEGPKVTQKISSLDPTGQDLEPDAGTGRGANSEAEGELKTFSDDATKVMMDFVVKLGGLVQMYVEKLKLVGRKKYQNNNIVNRNEQCAQMLSAQADALESDFVQRGTVDSIAKAVECRRQALSLTPEGHAQRPHQLSTLGVSLGRKFNRQGDLADIDQAIQYLDQAMHLTPETHLNRLTLLNHLGGTYQARFMCLGKLVDIAQAIEYWSQAVNLAPNSYPAKPGLLSSIGNSCMHRFERLGELVDVNKAIDCQTRAVQLTPDGHPDRPGQLNNLGSSYMRRFERLGQLDDIDKAIECHTQAVPLTPDDHPHKPILLNNLGGSYKGRFERLGKLADLDKATECQTKAVQLTPDSHPAKLGLLNNLGTSYLCLFEQLGELAYVDKAIESQTQAVHLTSDGHPHKPVMLNNLGNSYKSRFERLGELTELDKAIECQAQAVQLTPRGHPQRPGLLNNLGTSYRRRFERLSQLADVDKAVKCQIEAVQLTPNSHPQKPSLLNNLGTSYRGRFERLGELADADEAIACQTQAVQLTPDNHLHKPIRLTNLGISFMRRFERLGELEDVVKGIEYQSQAVQLTSDGHPDQPSRLNNLGNSYIRRFERLWKLEDVNKAIECQTQAVRRIPDGHPERTILLNNLGTSYMRRFEQLGEIEDLEMAIGRLNQAVQLTPDGHPDKPSWLYNLGGAYMWRFERAGEPADLKCAQSSFQQGAEAALTNPESQLRCARDWAKSSSLLSLSPQQAYERCIQLVPHLIWLGTTINHRYTLITAVSDLATEAASWAISVQYYDLAIEWLEEGRSIVWNQILHLRTPVDDLSIVDPRLAQRLKDIASQLESAGSRGETQGSSIDVSSDLEQTAQHHRRLAEEWEKCVEQVRSIPGFHNFLHTRKAGELKLAANDGPVVLINTHTTRCDALILFPHCDDIVHVSLPRLTPQQPALPQGETDTIAQQRGDLDRGLKLGKAPYVDPLNAALGALWSDVVHPVLDALVCKCKEPATELPHLTWCVTGWLAFFPLHAAGTYSPDSSSNAFDLVVSSYTPTLSALITSNVSIAKPDLGLLAVGQEHTQGLSHLPWTIQELAEIKRYSQELPFLQLDGGNATVDAVLNAMNEHSWVHLACHATQTPDTPSQSGFHLHNGTLTLEAITKRQFKNKGLAFLSACQTAKGDGKLPDEAVHLAAGLLMGGYPSVIATMWSIADVDGPDVAGRVYAELLKDGKMDHRGAARALHKAVAELRGKVGVGSFARWVPFIHIGA